MIKHDFHTQAPCHTRNEKNNIYFIKVKTSFLKNNVYHPCLNNANFLLLRKIEVNIKRPR
jgi:hypothetical protein